MGVLPNLSNQEYHEGPGVSNSGLKLLRKSPYHYAASKVPLPEWLHGSGDESDDEATRKARMFAGTLCHCATLEPEAFDERYAVGPDVRRNTKEWKAAVEANPGRVLIKPRQKAVAIAQASALHVLEPVAEVLEGGMCEVSAYWRDEATGLLCKCRPDCVNASFGTVDEPAAVILDVKTTTDAGREAARVTVARYGYHHQADWYSRGFTIASGIPVVGFIFAFVENEWPFAVAVYELDPYSLEVAARENRQALELVAQCERTGLWPSYPADVQMLSLPRWAGGAD